MTKCVATKGGSLHVQEVHSAFYCSSSSYFWVAPSWSFGHSPLVQKAIPFDDQIVLFFINNTFLDELEVLSLLKMCEIWTLKQLPSVPCTEYEAPLGTSIFPWYGKHYWRNGDFWLKNMLLHSLMVSWKPFREHVTIPKSSPLYSMSFTWIWPQFTLWVDI